MLISLPTKLEPLAKLLEKDEPKVLVVVGAGVSIGATGSPHADWLGLLLHGIEHLVQTEAFTPKRGKDLSRSLKHAFSPFDLQRALQHAELVEQNLSTPDASAFANWLGSAFRDFKASENDKATLQVLHKLQQAGALLLTTNYDSLLSDATGLPPVTWEEHEAFLKAIHQPRSGILHIHGHWLRPNSVVLGSRSYERIVQDEVFQTALRSLWLHWSWVYVGCGDGLDDPNLSRLLEWGKQWGEGALPDYFLAKNDKALALETRSDRPSNLVSVGFRTFMEIPDILKSLTPDARCAPFVRIDEDFYGLRSPAHSSTLPFPSYQEYLEGLVPSFSADEEVKKRIAQYGWSFVLDVASSGKTTLGLRLATSPEQREHPSYYVDCSNLNDEDERASAASAMQRLVSQGTLLILDNIHYQPEFARLLWEHWRERPRGSRLLLIATHNQRSTMTAPAQDLAFFERHPENPSVKLCPSPQDLVAILHYTHSKLAGPFAQAISTPPLEHLQSWHEQFGNALGAFCMAIMGHLTEFKRGNWALPPQAAADWVREKWLLNLGLESLENLICLAAFGSQEVEMEVTQEALPHPPKMDRLLKLGLAIRFDVGQLRQYHRFRLRVPSWGRLILAGISPEVDEEEVLFESAARHPMTAGVLSSRFRRAGLLGRRDSLWSFISRDLSGFGDRLQGMVFHCYTSLMKEAAGASQGTIICSLWEAIERDPAKLADRAMELPLTFVASFLDTAKRHQRNTDPLWEAIERDPAKLADRALERSLSNVASFLDTAKRHQRNTDPLWEAIERDPAKLADRAWETPLGAVASFLDTAKRHQRNTTALWEAIERDPAKFADRAWETPLGDVASFLDTAKRHQRNTVPLWEAIERDPAKLADRAWETSLEHAASFLETAKAHQRNTVPLWEAIERDPIKLAARAWETSLGHVASFLETAKAHQRNTVPLWEAIERDPTKLAARAWETSLEHVASFLQTAKAHQRNTVPLWEEIERDPAKLAARAWETSLEHVASFLEAAKAHQRNTASLWEALEREPEKVASVALGSDLKSLATLLGVVRRHGREITMLVEAMASRGETLSAIATTADMAALAGFCRVAPSELIAMALIDFLPSHWDGFQLSDSMMGATWVANRCLEIGRDDLKNALILALLQRSNFQDFPAKSTALASINWLLEHTPPNEFALVPAFLDAICTKRWLKWQINQTACKYLAGGLWLLAMRQPPEISRRFWDDSLRFRMRKELSQFHLVEREQQSYILQLLGSAALFRCPMQAVWFQHLPIRELGSLIYEQMPHRAESDKIEPFQSQIWLGLRAASSITGIPVAVPAALISRTLELWRANLAESEMSPGSFEHRVNQSMVSFIETCWDSRQGRLVPSRELLPVVYEKF